MHFSVFAEGRLAALESAMRDWQGEEPLVVAVVRCWNKGPEEWQAFEKELKKMTRALPSLQGIILCLKGEDENGLTEKTLEEIHERFSIPILPLSIERYSWTSALNAGASIVNEIALANELNRDLLKVLVVSFDAEVFEDGLRTLHHRLTKRFVMSVRGQQPPVDFEARYLRLLSDVSVAPPAEYVDAFRNTLELYPLRDLLVMGGFHPGCNVTGGMEDIEFFLRFLARASRMGRKDILLEFEEALKEPIFYSDRRFATITKEKQEEKVKQETLSLKRIFANSLRTLEGSSVPEDQRDFLLRA